MASWTWASIHFPLLIPGVYTLRAKHAVTLKRIEVRHPIVLLSLGPYRKTILDQYNFAHRHFIGQKWTTCIGSMNNCIGRVLCHYTCHNCICAGTKHDPDTIGRSTWMSKVFWLLIHGPVYDSIGQEPKLSNILKYWCAIVQQVVPLADLKP